jgi:hypothetical protein
VVLEEIGLFNAKEITMTQEQKATKAKSQLAVGEKSVVTGKVICVSALGSRYDSAQLNGIYPGDLSIELNVHFVEEGTSYPQIFRGIGPVDVGQTLHDPNWKTNLVEISERAMDAFLNYGIVTIEFIYMGPFDPPLIWTIR